ncbi:MAG: SprT family zinc-dependent metalloprotease [Steroidobacteraceae bacterium]
MLPRHSGQLALWDEIVPLAQLVSVRHSQRARRVSVRIGATGRVELVVPRGVSERRAWAFLESRAEWVRHHVARRRSAAPPSQAFPPRELSLPLLGENWRLFQAGGAGRTRIVVGSGVLELRGSGDPAAWRRCLLRWLKRRGEQALAPRLAAAAAAHGFRYTQLRVRSQRTRWGSCSTRGVISLNLALLFQPEDVVHYLLCHELSHTRHMNHSARFWDCVEACEPRWRELDRALTAGWRHVPAWIGEEK